MKIKLSPDWYSDTTGIPEDALISAFLKGYPCPLTLLKNAEFSGGFAIVSKAKKGLNFEAVEASEITAWAPVPRFVIEKEEEAA